MSEFDKEHARFERCKKRLIKLHGEPTSSIEAHCLFMHCTYESRGWPIEKDYKTMVQEFIDSPLLSPTGPLRDAISATNQAISILQMKHD